MTHSPDPRWLRVQELFDTASTWPPAERTARLTQLETDPTLRAEVLDLLTASDAETEANQRYSAPPAVTEAPAPTPEFIGPYRILRTAGAGGRGRVYEATREVAGLSQRVALKVMLDHLIAPSDLARFEREQRLLASLDHPSIARFVEAGWDANQRPFLVMDWVDGDPIDQYCSRQSLPIPHRIRLVIALLDALEAAHRGLIVHLDLKPSNILVDPHGRVRVLDFGTAKLLSDTDSTYTQQLTPFYSSPERLRGEPVTTACDIYSAALVLHELIAGASPFRVPRSIAGLGERAAGTATLHIQTGAPDLDAILHKALQFRPADRYPSAAAFAADLQAFLDRRPVRARRPTPWYRFHRFLARHRAAAAVGAAAFLALAALGVFAVRQRQQRDREAQNSREIAAFLRWMITSSAVAGSGRPAMTVAEMVHRGHQRIAAGTPLPDDVAAAIQADFAYLTQEHGREDLAQPIARDALARADRGGQPEARLKARATLAILVMRSGRCPEAIDLFRTADALLQSPGSAISSPVQTNYLLSRAAAAEQCEAKLTDAIRLTESAIRSAASLPRENFGVEPAVFRAAAHLQLALFLARAGRHPESLRAAGDGLALAASHPDGRYLRVALLRIRSQAHAAASNPNAALDDIREAARQAPGVVNPFEEVRLQTLLAGRLADAGDRTGAARLARDTVSSARTRAAEIGPSFWMILADAAEVLAKCDACPESQALYRDVDTLTKGQMPRTWRGNRLFYAAECAHSTDPRRAAVLARQALETYGELLPAASKRRQRLNELAQAAAANR